MGDGSSLGGVRTLRLQVTLREVTPPVLRVIDVPVTSTLPELHELLQAGLGWTDSHLHEFLIAGPRTDPWAAGVVRYGIPDPYVDDLDPIRDEATARLRDLSTEFVYLYDFGDNWTHDVTVLGPGADRPGCVYGEGPCPPEDCGGLSGHAELLAILADPSHDDHTHLRTWAGPQFGFDQDAADALLRRTAGAVPASVTLLLDLVGRGTRLTRRAAAPHPRARRAGTPAQMGQW